MKALNRVFATMTVFSSLVFGAAHAQEGVVYTDAESCLDHVHELENQSLTADLNADEFNLLIEILVEATDLCRTDSLIDAQQQLANAVDMIAANS